MKSVVRLSLFGVLCFGSAQANAAQCTLSVTSSLNTTVTLQGYASGSNCVLDSQLFVNGAELSNTNPMPIMGTVTGTLTDEAVATSEAPSYSAATNPLSMTLTGGLRVQLSSGGSDITTLPVSLAALPALSAGSAAIGSVTVTSLPSIPAGSNAIGGVTQSGIWSMRGTIMPTVATPTSCGGTTSATAGTSTALLAAGNWSYHLMLQNNGTAPVLVSFIVSAGTPLTTSTAYALASGQTFTNPDTMPSGTLVTVQSATASQPIMCEYR